MRRAETIGSVVVLGLGLLLADPADAACTVSVTGVAFGTYNPSSADDSTGAINARCTIFDGAPVVAIGTGNSGSFAPRRMSGGGASLSYNLYTNTARSNVWGDGSRSTSTVTLSGGTPYLYFWRDYSRPVYGRIPAGQQVAAGGYFDTIVVTVIF